jgi:PadR family transcriptional regulator PadR
MLSAKTYLLQALVTGAGYGLELIDRVREKTNNAVVLGQGSIYPALRSLEAEGLVTSWEGPTVAERGGRPRRYYHLTAEGLRAAREQRETLLGFLKASEVLA